MDLYLAIDRTGKPSLRDQLFAALRGAILDGRVGTGQRLPSSRALATQLGVSRLTVDDAYTRLVSEGYASGRRGSGTYVVANLSAGIETRATEGVSPPVRDAGPPRHWSGWAERVMAEAPPTRVAPPRRYDFRQGMPALDELPVAAWNRVRTREARTVDLESYHYGPSGGDDSLRAEIAGYLGRARGIRCEAEQVVITTGAQQGLDLVTRLWVDPGQAVAMEEPGYPAARRIFAAAGARIVPVPVGAHGIQVDRLEAADNKRQLAGETGIRLVYVTPSHQYPTGGVLPLERRIALLTWARRVGALVLEDDYDAEFRYGARPVEALAGLDLAMPGPGAVVYVGTFSKVLYPALRLGYLVLPRDMAERAIAARALSDRQVATLDQRALAAFLRSGDFERHTLRMRRLYSARRAAALEALATELSGIASRDPASTAAGLHLLVRFETRLSEAEIIRRAAAVDVHLDPASPCFVEPPAGPAVMLGYAGLSEGDIREGIARLGRVLRGSDARGPLARG